jgi:glutamate N-acetyltransferase/amino-acid N-acetyltransferase
VSSTQLVFSDRAAHRAWLAEQATLPEGFRVGTTRFDFIPREAPKPAKMTLTLIALDRPTKDFAAVFTKNALPGAPVIIGRQRLHEETLSAIIVNNKISNVCAPGGVETSEAICEGVARELNHATKSNALTAKQVLPSSTGVIGWTLPEDSIKAALPQAVASLKGGSILPAAEGIVTTDLYPKIRYAKVGAGRIVGIAKGAGMIEPNLATMLVYVLTDLAVPREQLRALLTKVVQQSFNTISIDSDTSTSDTVALVSSGKVPCPDLAVFEKALQQVCTDLAEDVVRNGEGVRHVIRVRVTGAPTDALARVLGKAIVNAPLFKCAVAGNDPNVGRLVQAIGKCAGALPTPLDLSKLQLRMGGIEIFSDGVFRLDPTKETALVQHLKSAELYESVAPKDGVFAPPIDFPRHERCVEIDVDLGSGSAGVTILGGDLTHEYVSENADYRS